MWGPLLGKFLALSSQDGLCLAGETPEECVSARVHMCVSVSCPSFFLMSEEVSFCSIPISETKHSGDPVSASNKLTKQKTIRVRVIKARFRTKSISHTVLSSSIVPVGWRGGQSLLSRPKPWGALEEEVHGSPQV